MVVTAPHGSERMPTFHAIESGKSLGMVDPTDLMVISMVI
jgi:hypothetical protein